MNLQELSIVDIQDGWKLKDGSLYLLVKCKDGIIRSIILPKKE